MKFLFPMGVPSRRTPSVSSALVVSFVVSWVSDCCCLLVRNCEYEMLDCSVFCFWSASIML